MKAQGIQDIPIAEIDTGFRLRPVDEGYAAMLAENIREVGRLRQPIEARTVKGGGYLLIAGAHRLTACVRLGWETIPAFVFEATEDEAEMAEIDENLVRHDLNPLDRAVFLARREEVYRRLHPEAKRGGDRRSQKSKGHDDTLIGFARETAEKTGISDSTVKRALRIARDLSPEIRALLAGTPLAHKQSELLALAKAAEGLRAAAAERIRTGEARTVRSALALAEGRRPEVETADQKQLRRLMEAWFAAKSASARKSFRDFILNQKEAA